MSTRPDELIARVPQSDVWAEAVEAHLDRFPLPVDESDVQRSVERLEGRLGIRRRRFPTGLVIGVLAAAVALFFAIQRLSPDVGQSQLASEPVLLHPAASPAIQHTVVPEEIGVELPFVTVGRSAVLAPGSRVISSERARSAVLLVQEGEAKAGEARIPARHWGLLTRVEDGTLSSVVFRDGEPVPSLDSDVWEGTEVVPQLRELRWQALPDCTLETLDALLEDSP